MNYKYMILMILILLLFNDATVLSQKKEFNLSEKCLKDDLFCTEEELEYKAIAELHSQIDDDKNGDIDIYESKDFVQGSLSTPHGSEKAKKFHKSDSHINKQDLWMIWKSSEVFNWTNADLVSWFIYEVELPQYSEIVANLRLNGSTMPRLTETSFLTNVLKVTDAIHKRKIMIKAVDAVLFGSNTKFQLSKKTVVTIGIVFLTVLGMLAFQILRSRNYMRNMENKLRKLTIEETNVSDLKSKLQEVEEIKTQKDIEIQELHQKHIKEIQKFTNASSESLNEDSQRLKEARHEIFRLTQALDEAHIRIDNLSKRSTNYSRHHSSDEAFLVSLLQWSKSMEEHYIREKEAVIDQECNKFKEWNEKLKKRKSGLFGSINLAHSGEMDEIEKGFLAMKRAYEKLIQEKQDLKWRWKQIEQVVDVNVGRVPENHAAKQAVITIFESNLDKQKKELNKHHIQRNSQDPIIGSMAYSGINRSKMFSFEDSESRSDDSPALDAYDLETEMTLSKTTNSSQHNLDEMENLSEQETHQSRPSLANNNVQISNPIPLVQQQASIPERSRRKLFFKSSRTRIPSLTRSGKN